MKTTLRSFTKSNLLLAITASLFLALAVRSWAQPTLVSAAPISGSIDVSPTTSIVFRFSEPMVPEATMAVFYSGTGATTTTPTWTENNTVLTCKPTPAFPTASTVNWMVMGTSAVFEDMTQPATGNFTTAGGTTTCTNYVGSFTVARGAFYEQNSDGQPVLNLDIPYAVVTCSSVACSNLTTTNLSVTVPTTPPQTLALMNPSPGHYSLTSPYQTLGNMETSFPPGNYTFFVQGPSFNLPYQVDNPSNLILPPAPHLTNYTAAQQIDATKDFVLGWDPYQSRATAGAIYVEIYGGAFSSQALGEPGCLNGSARSVTIPGGTLQPNKSYSGSISFYDCVLKTNNNSITLAYRSSVTEFTLATSDGSAPVQLTTVSSELPFSFEFASSPGQVLTVEWNSTLAPGQWQTLLSTNPTGTRVKITDPASTSPGARYYRVKKGL